MSAPLIVLFRNDLRLDDNPVLHYAALSHKPIIALYILDKSNPNRRIMGAASTWWLHHSLHALSADLRARYRLPLTLRRGAQQAVLERIIAETQADNVMWGRRYDAPSIATDDACKATLEASGIAVQSFNSSLLVEPWEVAPKTAPYYKVFTPFWKACMARGIGHTLHPIPHALSPYATALASDTLQDWNLTPSQPDWAAGFTPHWQPGEAGGKACFLRFLERGLSGYKNQRNFPAKPHGTSQLSAHLRFGEISPNRIMYSIQQAEEAPEIDRTHFLSELGWREFSYHLLYHFPQLSQANFRPTFNAMQWENNPNALAAWQQGRTGFPIIDAGMRQLWQTGSMHNRVRMVVASFLTKDLFIDWRQGEAWFWDTLLDADPANNPASWQWVAGSGADAAPYFRIFNPTTQSKRFDPEGEYIRTFVPELADMPTRYIHAPELAPKAIAAPHYPPPIVHHATQRQEALRRYKAMKGTV